MSQEILVTVTLNPAIDETVFLDQLIPGSVNRARHHHRQPGGKGVNVSSMLAQHGISSTATGFLGRENTAPFEEMFRSEGIHDAFVRIDGETRTGIKIVAESQRQTTDINFPGARPQPADLAALGECLSHLLRPGAWLVLAGSLPSGITLDDFRWLLALGREAGARIAVDSSGPALLAAIDCGVTVIKPNHHELGEILGRELPDAASRTDAARTVQREGVPHVIVSMGAEGAVFACPEGTFIANPPPVDVVSTVGAGDSMLAGYLAGLVTGLPAPERAALATAFSCCAIEHVTRRLCPPADLVARMKTIPVSQVS